MSTVPTGQPPIPPAREHSYGFAGTPVEDFPDDTPRDQWTVTLKHNHDDGILLIHDPAGITLLEARLDMRVQCPTTPDPTPPDVEHGDPLMFVVSASDGHPDVFTADGKQADQLARMRRGVVGALPMVADYRGGPLLPSTGGANLHRVEMVTTQQLRAGDVIMSPQSGGETFEAQRDTFLDRAQVVLPQADTRELEASVHAGFQQEAQQRAAELLSEYGSDAPRIIRDIMRAFDQVIASPEQRARAELVVQAVDAANAAYRKPAEPPRVVPGEAPPPFTPRRLLGLIPPQVDTPHTDAFLTTSEWATGDAQARGFRAGDPHRVPDDADLSGGRYDG